MDVTFWDLRSVAPCDNTIPVAPRLGGKQGLRTKMINHPNRNRTIYADRISGDLYQVMTSYDSTAEQMSRAMLDRMARKDDAAISISNARFLGDGLPESEFVPRHHT